MKFIKAHSLGNDFIIIKDEKSLSKSEINALCKRNFGIGADGIVSLNISDEIVNAEFFNSDGSEASLCGNASRICAKILIDEYSIDRMSTKAGIIFFHRDKDKYGVSIPLINDEKTIDIDGNIFSIINTGVSHIIIECENFDSKRKKLSESFSEFYDYNWDFIKQENNEIFVNTYERGVGYTLGCSTGAAAVAIHLNKKTGRKIFDMKFPGGPVKAIVKNNIIDVYAEVHIIYHGEIK